MIKNLDNEIWKVHPTYTDYAASNYGGIKSFERDVYKKDGSFHQHLQEKLIKLQPNKDGYLKFHLFNTNLGIDKWVFVHRFCYECFKQVIIPDDLEINHIDCNRSNNQISNLELLDHQSNVDYSVSKQVGQYTLDGELIKIWKSTNEAEREGGFSHGNISKCCNSKRKTHKGFLWKYIEG